MKDTLDFIVIGAQKAGTTALFEYLRRHPDIRLPPDKEVPYFSHDSNYSREWSEYLRKAFPFADTRTLWGTVTPHYMVGGLYHLPGTNGAVPSDERTVPSRIHDRLPAVRLIAVVRDPVERARSHHAMAIMNGWESRPFADAVGDLLRPEALERARRLPEETSGYVTWGEYGRILGGYLDVFPRDQLLVLYSDDLKHRPEATIRRVFGFLGVDPEFIPDNLGRTYRMSGSARRLRWLDLSAFQASAASNSVLRGGWHTIPEPTRRRINVGFNRLNYLTDLWNRRPGHVTLPDDAVTERALRDHYREDGERLTRLLGDAPRWAAAHRAS